uniref:2'-5' oligoadenylate synthase n=1 Tax=Chelydra serpentina TaxID=8475 RepID=A0A8C3SZU1_CHESE
MALDLYQTPARKLDKFIFDTLQPDSTFLRQAGQAIDTICEFLKTNCFADRPPPRIKVLKGGSLGKGTSLKGGSDADLVVFLSCFKGFGDQETNRAGIIKEIERMLEKCQQQKHFEVFIEQSRWPNPRVLSFMMSSKTLNESIEFDVLPAYNALCTSCCPYSVYEELIHSYSRGGEFSTCFTELQRDFVVDRRTKVKSLIRLVKHWYKQHVCPYKEYLGEGESLPPQYALELLSVYAWEQGSRDRAFDMAEGFRTVLELIRQHKQLCVYWTIYYNFADEVLAGFLHQQLQKARSVSLPAPHPAKNGPRLQGEAAAALDGEGATAARLSPEGQKSGEWPPNQEMGGGDCFLSLIPPQAAPAAPFMLSEPPRRARLQELSRRDPDLYPVLPDGAGSSPLLPRAKPSRL